MSYTPRGQVKTILDAMAEHGKTLEWKTEELAELVGAMPTSMSNTLAAAVSHGFLFKQKRGIRTYWSLEAYDQAPEAEGEEDAPKFRAALWDDGDLIIYGAVETEDGGILLTKDQLAQIKRMVTWSAPA